MILARSFLLKILLNRDFRDLDTLQKCDLVLQHNAQHAPQRFGCAPQQLIAAGERRQIFWPHVELAQSAHWNYRLQITTPLLVLLQV